MSATTSTLAAHNGIRWRDVPTGDERVVREWITKLRSLIKKCHPRGQKGSHTDNTNDVGPPFSPEGVRYLNGKPCKAVKVSGSIHEHFHRKVVLDKACTADDSSSALDSSSVGGSEWAPEHAMFVSQHIQHRAVVVPPGSSIQRVRSIVPTVVSSNRTPTMASSTVLDAYARAYENGRKVVVREGNENILRQRSACSNSIMSGRSTTHRDGSISADAREQTKTRLHEDRMVERRGFKKGWDQAWEAMKKEGWTRGCRNCAQPLGGYGGVTSRARSGMGDGTVRHGTTVRSISTTSRG